MSMESLEGKVAVVTGGASGIGLAMARRFASEGARIVLADLAEDALRSVASDMESDGVEVLAVPTDVADAESVENMARCAMDRFGSVQLLCNNAGVVASGKSWELPLADWLRIVGVHFWGVLHGVHTFVPLILASGEAGYIVNTASLGGLFPVSSRGRLPFAPYMASKRAIVALSEVLRHELLQIGAPIGVSVLCPGPVSTNLGRTDKLAPIPESPEQDVLSAEQVAECVRRGIAEGRFYIFTHPDYKRLLDAHHAAIIDGMEALLIHMPNQE
jgi:NAD(P)-dependent dehydrogenase (short-subunit alcohol dehydrogenase family)